MSQLSWPDAGRGLLERVRALADGESVTLTASEEHARPTLVRKGWLGGFIPARHEMVAPWVRLERVEDHLRGQCVGAETLGGSFPLSQEEDAALVALGWRHPGSGDGEHYIRFWPDDVAQGPFLPHDDAERAVAMIVATFEQVLAPVPESGAEPAPGAGP
jgi:hypothetical protein